VKIYHPAQGNYRNCGVQ